MKLTCATPCRSSGYMNLFTIPNWNCNRNESTVKTSKYASLLAEISTYKIDDPAVYSNSSEQKRDSLQELEVSSMVGVTTFP